MQKGQQVSLAVVSATISFLTLLSVATAAPENLALAMGSVTESSASEFSSGLTAGVAIGEADGGLTGGRLHLDAALNDIFLSETLAPRWIVTRPLAGYIPVIEDGSLDVQERNDEVFQLSSIESDTTFSAGIICEARALVNPGSAFVYLGFVSSTVSPTQWAYFGTRGTGNEIVPMIKTSVRGVAGSTPDVPTGAPIGEWHVFKIVWTTERVDFYIDGALVDSRTNVDIAVPQHFGLFKSSASSSSFLVDWVRITPYTASPGTYESSVLDAGVANATWMTLDWQGAAPDTTTVGFETRTGESPGPDENWAPWSPVTDGNIGSQTGRFVQYRATLTSDNLLASPVIDEVRLTFNCLDLAPPVVTATMPPADATDILTSTQVSATFDEPLDPTSLTEITFTLSPQGGLPVLAAVSYDSTTFTATLVPAVPLAFSSTHEVRLSTLITDLDGNPLGTDHAWSFTTTAPDLVPPGVTATVPLPGAQEVLVDRRLAATFTEAVDPTTLTPTSFSVVAPGGSALAATVSYDAGTFTATLDPAVDLALDTEYEVRLTTAITDLAGNSLPHDAVWTFVTRLDAPVGEHASAAVDFHAGSLSDLMITEVDSSEFGGQLRLQGLINDTFDGPSLAPIWNATNPVGYSPVIVDGILNVQEQDPSIESHSTIESYASWGPGVMLEARAMFVPGSRFIDVGFDATTNGNNQYAWFSTNGTGDMPGQETITARVREYDHNTVAIATGATFNEWHIFKIIWTQGRVEFFVDGMHVATHTDVLITLPMHAAFYKSNYSETPYYIDWVRVTPYTAPTGSYESPVLDGGSPSTSWTDLEWAGTTPDGGRVDFATRTGSTPDPDGTWSAWQGTEDGLVVSPPARFAQYRAELATTNPLVSPVVDDITIYHGAVPDLTAPTVTSTDPIDGSTGILTDAQVTVTFSERLDAGTLTTESFTLTPDGGSPVLATVSYDSATSTATLTPADPLAHATLYHAQLTTAIADTAGNLLASAHQWTFTTGQAVGVPENSIPSVTALLPNAPNPFNPATSVKFDLASSGHVVVRVFSIDGRLVRTLVDADLAAGRHSQLWNGRDDSGQCVATGTYLLRMQSPDWAQTRKVQLVK